MRGVGSIIATVFFIIAAVSCFSMRSIGAGILAIIIAVAIWLFTAPSEEDRIIHENKNQNRLDKATRARMQRVNAQKRKQYIRQLDFSKNFQLQKLINDLLKTNYLNIVLTKEYIMASGKKFMYSEYGMNNMQTDELEKLAKYFKEIVQKQKKDTYTIKPIKELVASGNPGTGGYYGVNQRGSVQWFGDSNDPDHYIIIGYKLYNDNFNVETGIYKVWDSGLRRYRQWDTRNAKWID